MDSLYFGSRVVPKKKSIRESLDKSKHWSRAKERNQHYLFAVGYSPDLNAWILADDKDVQNGDFFKIEDFTVL